MIGYVSGELIKVTEESCVIDNNGMGYNILISGKLAQELPPIGDSCRIYTYMSVREDAIKLYGFGTDEELEFFKMLITVGGIGPKVALGILSVMSPYDLKMAIISSDSKTISKCPGIGAKTAQRIILDLKDKVDVEEMLDTTGSEEVRINKSELSEAAKEAVEALTALGYSQTESFKAVKKVQLSEDMDVEAILKAALKNF